MENGERKGDMGAYGCFFCLRISMLKKNVKTTMLPRSIWNTLAGAYLGRRVRQRKTVGESCNAQQSDAGECGAEQVQARRHNQ